MAGNKIFNGLSIKAALLISDQKGKLSPELEMFRSADTVELSGFDNWLDTKTWEKAADEITRQAGSDTRLFLEAGKRCRELDLLGAIEFLPWFLSTPELFIRNLVVFQEKLDKIFTPRVEFLLEDRCLVSFGLISNQTPSEHYLDFLQGFLTSALELWDFNVTNRRSSWNQTRDSWLLELQWTTGKKRYRRAIEELFIYPEFYRSVIDSLEQIYSGRTDRLEKILQMNKQLRGLTRAGGQEESKAPPSDTKAENPYASLFTELDDGLVRITNDGTILDADSSALRLLDFGSLDEFKSESPRLSDLFSDPDRLGELLSRKEDGLIRKREFTVRHGDGSANVVSVGVYVDQLVNEADEIELLLGKADYFVRNILDYGKTHQFLEAIFLHNPSGLQVIDEEGWTVRINPQLEKLFGFDPDEIVGRRKYNIIDDPNLKNTDFVNAIKRTMAGEPMQLQSIRLSGNNSPLCRGLSAPLYVSVTMYPLRLSDGRVNNVVVSYSDITEAMLVQQQLNQLDKMKSIGTLASGIAHDFNNILGAIVPNADLIMQLAEDQEQIYKKASTIKIAAKRAASLTQQMISFARKSTGDRKPMDINGCAGEAVELICNAIPKQVSIDFEPGENLPMIMADALQMQQVIINLIINASDASLGGGVISVRAFKTVLKEKTTFAGNIIPEGSYVTLSVTDEGTGMPQEVSERVFDPFFTTKEKGRGTGLGLSVVHNIVKNHLGFITIDTKPGRGTMFEVHLPATGDTDS